MVWKVELVVVVPSDSLIKKEKGQLSVVVVGAVFFCRAITPAAQICGEYSNQISQVLARIRRKESKDGRLYPYRQQEFQ